MKRILITFVLGLLAAMTGAQPAAPVSRVITEKWDLDATVETFAILDAFQTPGDASIETVASSATVTAVSGTPFANLAVNSLLLIPESPLVGLGSFRRTISAKASSTSITASSAVNLDIDGGYKFNYQNLNVGTATTSGAFSVSEYSSFTISVDLLQMVATGGVSFRVLCRGRAADDQWRQVDPALVPPAAGPTYYNYAAAGGFKYATNIPFGQCRVGALIVTGDDGAGDLTTNQEQISISVEGRK